MKRRRSPLELKRYYVLLALAAGPLHAYGIYRQIASDSQLELVISLVTLERILQEMLRRQYIEIYAERPAGSKTIMFYQLTQTGRRRFSAAGRSLQMIVQLSLTRI